MTGGLAVTSITNSTVVNTAAAATTTTSFSTLAEGDLLIVIAIATSGAAFTDTTTVSGKGYTWTKIGSAISGNDIITMHAGYGTLAGAPDTNNGLTITFSRTPTAGRYVVWRVPKVCFGTTNPIVASNSTSGTGTGGSVVLTPVAGSDARYGFWGHRANEGTSPDATGLTWTEDLDDNSPTSLAVGYEAQHVYGNDNTHTATWATSSFYVGVVLQVSNTVGITVKTGGAPIEMRSSPVVIEDDEAVWAII